MTIQWVGLWSFIAVLLKLFQTEYHLSLPKNLEYHLVKIYSKPHCRHCTQWNSNMAKPSQVCNHNLIPVVGLELHLFGLIMTKCLIISIKNVCRNQKLYYGWLCQASKIAQNRHIFYLLICHLLISIPWKCIGDSINSSCPQTSFPMLADLTMCIWINKPIINSRVQ